MDPTFERRSIGWGQQHFEGGLRCIPQSFLPPTRNTVTIVLTAYLLENDRHYTKLILKYQINVHVRFTDKILVFNYKISFWGHWRPLEAPGGQLRRLELKYRICTFIRYLRVEDWILKFRWPRFAAIFNDIVALLVHFSALCDCNQFPPVEGLCSPLESVNLMHIFTVSGEWSRPITSKRPNNQAVI